MKRPSSVSAGPAPPWPANGGGFAGSWGGVGSPRSRVGWLSRRQTAPARNHRAPASCPLGGCDKALPKGTERMKRPSSARRPERAKRVEWVGRPSATVACERRRVCGWLGRRGEQTLAGRMAFSVANCAGEKPPRPASCPLGGWGRVRSSGAGEGDRRSSALPPYSIEGWASGPPGVDHGRRMEPGENSGPEERKIYALHRWSGWVPRRRGRGLKRDRIRSAVLEALYLGKSTRPRQRGRGAGNRHSRGAHGSGPAAVRRRGAKNASQAEGIERVPVPDSSRGLGLDPDDLERGSERPPARDRWPRAGSSNLGDRAKDQGGG